jgi:hypothetical protein
VVVCVNTVALAAELVHEVVGRLNRVCIEEMRWDESQVLKWEVAGIVAPRAPHQLVRETDQHLLAEAGPGSLAIRVPHKWGHTQKTVSELLVFHGTVVMTRDERVEISSN